MLVKDIYGTHSPLKDLKGDILASSFAKLAGDVDLFNKVRLDEMAENYRKEDILKALIIMISYNIGQLAYTMA
jgi:pantothenate kinase